MSGINAIFDGTCSVERDSSTPSGKSGGDRSFSAVATGEPCRINEMGAEELSRPENVGVATHRGYFRDGIDLGRQDRVVKDGVTYEVEWVVSAPGGVGSSHVEAGLWEVV